MRVTWTDCFSSDRRISAGILRLLIATHQTNQFEDLNAFRVDEIGENRALQPIIDDIIAKADQKGRARDEVDSSQALYRRCHPS